MSLTQSADKPNQTTAKTYVLSVKSTEKYQRALEILNAVLIIQDKHPYTEGELKVLVEFIKLHYSFPAKPEYVFTAVSKQRVAKALNISMSNLTNYIGYIKSKGGIVKHPTTGVFSISKNILPEYNEKDELIIAFKLIATND